MTIEDLPPKMEEYFREGFVLVENVLTAGQVEAMRTALAAAIAAQDRAWGDNPHYIDAGMVHNPMVHDPVFLEIFSNDRINGFLEAALDEHCILYACTSSSMPPHGTNYSGRIHVDCPRVIPGYPTNIGFLIAFDDFTRENGATYFLPRSFERTDPPDDAEFFDNAARPLPRAGDAILFNARTWHMGGQNKTDRYRHAFTMNVCRSYMRQRFDYPRLLGEGLLETLDERALKRLGYRVRVPVDLDEYYVPQEQRLYLGGQG